MAYDDSDLRDVFRLAEVELKRREDDADLKAEMAGLPNGKMARFLGEDHRDERRHGRSSGDARKTENLSRLQMLLASNPAYARAYTQTLDELGDAEDATDRAIAKAQADLEAAQAQLQRTLDKAAKLPDGTRVFRDARGEVWNERRERVGDEAAAGIEWRGDEPAYEQFLEDSESAKDRLTRLEGLQGFRVDTLGRIRDRMMDRDNPLTEHELHSAQTDMRNGLKRFEIAPPVSMRAAIEPVATSSLPVPDLG
ncbi:hypothetical protein [Hyphomicrobium sp. NDB2Meth4]|uniref:hypothetical protein n=1 Tax=Hyphomicrobium sp. NDB2Meth4 TaxID=1892846 RepID=UPI000930FA19|nr:hypothetical protein [Hyphomicrobium sp. NDB2Meth4]